MLTQPNNETSAESDLLASLTSIQSEELSDNIHDSQSINEEILFSEGNYQERTINALKAERYANNTGLRKKLAYWAFVIVTLWLVCVMLILAYNYDRYKLSDNVLIALLTTTTANVLGIIYIVLKDLFNGKSEA